MVKKVKQLTIKPRVFLWGTSGGNWRRTLTDRLIGKGVPALRIINSADIVVKTRLDEQILEDERKLSSHRVICLGKAEEEETEMLVLFLEEACRGLRDSPKSTVVILDSENMTDKNQRVLDATRERLRAKYPMGYIYESSNLDPAVALLAFALSISPIQNLTATVDYVGGYVVECSMYVDRVRLPGGALWQPGSMIYVEEGKIEKSPDGLRFYAGKYTFSIPLFQIHIIRDLNGESIWRNPDYYDE